MTSATWVFSHHCLKSSDGQPSKGQEAPLEQCAQLQLMSRQKLQTMSKGKGVEKACQLLPYAKFPLQPARQTGALKFSELHRTEESDCWSLYSGYEFVSSVCFQVKAKILWNSTAGRTSLPVADTNMLYSSHKAAVPSPLVQTLSRLHMVAETAPRLTASILWTAVPSLHSLKGGYFEPRFEVISTAK